MRIEVVSGTNRPDSNSRRLSGLIAKHYEAAGVEVGIIDLKDMPAEIFRPEAYGEKPDAFCALSERVLAANGLHIVTPEYNGSFPGVLKYFIDMLKFPEAFEHRCVAFTGLAAGGWGGLRSVEQLEMVFNYRNAYMLPERVFLPAFHTLWDEASGAIKDEFKAGLLADQAKLFVDFVRRNGGQAAGEGAL